MRKAYRFLKAKTSKRQAAFKFIDFKLLTIRKRQEKFWVAAKNGISNMVKQFKSSLSVMGTICPQKSFDFSGQLTSSRV